MTHLLRRWFGVLAAALVLLTCACGPTSSATSTAQAGQNQSGQNHTNQGARPAGGATDPTSGLAWINESALPSQAAHTLAEIRAGGPYDYPRNDNVTYHNNNHVLPREPDGYYHEYTVRTPGSSTRGARRIIRGRGGELYWTADHYSSFQRIREGQ